MTVVGDMRETPKTDELKSQFMSKHPQSYYVDFDDFKCFKMEVKTVRYIGGFGEMGWVAPDDYTKAVPDQVFLTSSGAVEHMNEDHLEHTLLMVRALGGIPEATAASVLSIDRYGFEVLADTASGKRRTRVGFSRVVSERDQLRKEMVDLTNRARTLLSTEP